MDKGQEQWDKLVNLPQEYEVDPSIAQRAIEDLQQKPMKKNWFRRKKKEIAVWGLSAVLTAGLALGIGIPLYNKFSAKPIVYYAVSDIMYEDVENPTAFVNEKGLDICYFPTAKTLRTKIATIVETGDLGFMFQEALIKNQTGFFDEVALHSVIKQNAEFSFYERYQSLNKVYSVQGITVEYKLTEMPNTYNRQILAKFSYENADYFLDIVTELDGLQQLEVYVNMLLD